MTVASLGRLKKRFSMGFNTINTARIKSVVKAAWKYCAVPAAMPMAATAQMVAAVVRPRTMSLRKKMVPAPRKPMPVTIWAATREGSVGLKPYAPTIVNRQEPRETMVTVRSPAARS